jgi:integrase
VFIKAARKTNIKKDGTRVEYWYHRVQQDQEVIARFRCRKANPKKCHGNYRSKDGHYCQAYRDAEDELNHREGKTAIDIGSLDALSDADRLALLEIRAIAKQRGTPLTSLVWSVKEAKGDLGHPIKLIEAMGIYLAKLEADSKDSGSEANYKKSKSVITQFVNHFKNIELHQLSVEKIRKWAEEKKEWKNDTKNRAFKTLVSWWNFFNNKGYNVGNYNPFKPADPSRGIPGLDYFKVLDERIDYLKLEEVGTVLKDGLECVYTAVIVVLVMLCGVRTEEACKLEWSDIDLGDDSDEPDIYIPHSKAKKYRATKDGIVRTAERTISLSPMQVAWLKKAKAAGGLLPVCNGTYNDYKGGKHQWTERTKKTGRGSAGGRPRTRKIDAVLPLTIGRMNVLRHTYCSYHYAHFESVGKTAATAGNSEQMIKQRYANKGLKKGVARKFWELMP